MSQNVEVGGAGSLVIAGLFIAVLFLLRSFYKRYNRASKTPVALDSREPGEDESN